MEMFDQLKYVPHGQSARSHLKGRGDIEHFQSYVLMLIVVVLTSLVMYTVKGTVLIN